MVSSCVTGRFNCIGYMLKQLRCEERREGGEICPLLQEKARD